MITIVDYKAGNLASVKKAFEHLGHEAIITEDPVVVREARHLVVPGIGHFAATVQLVSTLLRDAICHAIDEDAYFLGICVGMQYMFQASDEAPGVPGMCLFPAVVKKFANDVKSPHVGWNQIEIIAPSRLLDGVESGSFVYYTHSYRAPVVQGTVAQTQYGGAFSGVIERDRLFGVQFHPEKSGPAGLKMLDNFAKLPLDDDLPTFGEETSHPTGNWHLSADN